MMNRRSIYAAALIVSLIAATALAAALAARHDWERAHATQSVRADRTIAHVASLEQTVLVGVSGLQGLFRSSDQVTAEEFRRYASGFADQAGISDAGYIGRVRSAHRSAPPSAREVLTHAGPGHAPGAADAYVLMYTAVRRPPPSLMTWDLRFDGVRWPIMQAARDSARPQASAPNELLRVRRLGVTFFAPVYGHAVPASVAGRRTALTGFVVVAQRADVLDRLLRDELGAIPFALVDEVSGRTLARSGVLPEMPTLRTVTIAGRTWRLMIGAGPAMAPWEPIAVVAVGLALIFGGSLLFFLGFRGERRANAAALLGLRQRDDAQRALVESERRSALIVDSSPDAILMMNERGVITSANPATQAVLGWAPEDLVGHRVNTIMPAAEGVAHDHILGRRPIGEGSRVIGHEREVRALRRDGTTIPILIAVNEAQVGGERQFVGIIHDITEQRRAEEEARRLAEEEAALLRIATAAAQDDGEQTVLRLMATEAAALIGADRALVARVAEPDRVEVLGLWARDEQYAMALGQTIRFPREAGAIGEVLSSGRSARRRRNVEPVNASDRDYLQHFETTVAAPIRIEERVWGVICAAAVEDSDLAPDAVARLERFANLASVAVTAAGARRQLAEMASTDHLTGLWNQRAFHERLREEVARARRTRSPLSLVILDVDHFKLVNDTHGHQAGDAVLAEFAQRLRGIVRGGETLARVGGEEFAWLLPDTDGPGAFQAAERARDAVCASPFPRVGVITTSAGVCDLVSAGEPGALYRNADTALYWAKNSGRNRTFRYEEEALAERGDDRPSRNFQRARSMAVIQVLANTIDARDRSTHWHSERVAQTAGELARDLGWDEERVALLTDAARVHDVGKIAIPDHILFKPGDLTEDEYAQIKEHAEIGAQMVSEVLEPEQVDWVRHHHERIDGGGYPAGLAGDEVSEGARILAVADAWDAMTNARPYGAPLPAEDAMLVLEESAGHQFCPRVVESMARLAAAAAGFTASR